MLLFFHQTEMLTKYLIVTKVSPILSWKNISGIFAELIGYLLADKF